MSLQSLEELLRPSPEEYRTLHQTITGLDYGDIERRAAVEQLPAWHLCSAAWSIVLARHTCQSSLTFLATDFSYQKGPNGHDLASFATVQASVNEDSTFAELLHKGLTISGDDKGAAHRPPVTATSSTVLVCPLKVLTSVPDLDLPQETKSHITIQLLTKRPKTIQATCRHRTSLPGHYLNKVVDHFLHLLRHLINYTSWASLRINDISMSSLEEEFQLRQECRPGGNLADMEVGSVHQLFRRQARRSPDRPALEGPGGSVLSYRELDLMSDLMAEDLIQRLLDAIPRPLSTGLAADSGVVVGISLQRSTAVVIAILSCWKAGCAVVLLDPSQPSARNGLIIEDCNCHFLLVGRSGESSACKDVEWRYDFDGLADRMKTTNKTTEAATSEIDLSKDLFRPAWIRVTSGSTGRPKCALHSHAAFGSSIASYAGRVRAAKTLLFFSPISSASGNAIWTFLTNGGCVCIPSQEELTSDLADCINRYGTDDICITPSALSLIRPDQVPNLMTASLAGEAVSRSVGETWSPHVSLLIGYGATEMNSHSLPFHDEPTGALPPAHPLPTSDYSLYIMRPGTLELCPMYVPGEICLSSTYMSSGYINRPEETSQVFVPHPFPNDAGHAYMYRTGDLGMFIGDRRFVVLGRFDFQFKVDGNRIQPEEIESIVNQIPQVIKSRVVLVQPSAGRPVMTCCVVLRETLANGIGPDQSWKDFVSAAERACIDRLPAYMMPHRWMQFKTFPETATAKTDTKALTQEAQRNIEKERLAVSTNGFHRQQGPISRRGRIFLDLALETLAGHDPDSMPVELGEKMQDQSFIASGGTSLLSMQLRSRLRKRGVEVSISTLYSAKSIIETALGFDDAEEGADETLVEENGTVLSLTSALLPRMPPDIQLDLYEAVFPTTMLQREMIVTSMLDPKLWMFYQFFDLSQHSCSVSQLREAICLLVSAKRNLRTILSLLDVPSNPTTMESPDSAFDLINNGEFVQAVLRPDAFNIEFLQEDDIEEPEAFWRQDVVRRWAFAKPLWRVAFLSKPRLLAWSFNHALFDAWVARNISRDLYATLAAIIQRDSCYPERQDALTDACEKAKKPSIEQWVLANYGTNGLSGSSPKSIVYKHMKRWEDYMANAMPTPIPDELRMPYESLPATPLMKRVESLGYGEWCRKHHVTAAALFHAVGALTIARLLDWWRPDGPQQPAEEITYYRLSSNRATVQDASEMEGALISISPMRVSVPASSNAVAISLCALQSWLSTQESDPYYLDRQLVPTGSEPTARRRRWGNVLFNHIVNQEGEGDPVPSFPGVVEDRCGFAMVWPFATLEIAVVETDPKRADTLQLCVLSTLERQSTESFVDVFAQILRLVVNTGSGMTAKEIVQQL